MKKKDVTKAIKVRRYKNKLKSRTRIVSRSPVR